MRAFDRAGITRDDLDALVLTDQDAFDGAAISSGMKVTPAGGYEKPVMRIQNGGGAGIHQAVAKIRAGKADVVSVVAADTVQTEHRMVSHISQEPLYARPIGQDHLQSYGILTNAHLERRDVTVDDLARTAAKNYTAASENPTAHRREQYTKADICESDTVVGPLRELMIGPVSYGAAVLILVSEEKAAELSIDPVWLTGIGINSSQYGYRDFDERLNQPALRSAAKAAYEGAGIKPSDVDAAEIAGPTPSFELLGYEALGFCDNGDGATLLRNGVTAPDGDLPVNLSGGPLATNPPNAGGIYRTIAAAQAIKDVGADRVVVADNDLHLGEPGRTDAVLVLEGGAS
ncbi:thiolase family protein [Haladaptatus sp. DFWS20]|uniref:thiolase family protein n=1 Tax=Haladaptatus sp. DFWS20 TaxID=3403467 RepID=UPI003EBCE29E